MKRDGTTFNKEALDFINDVSEEVLKLKQDSIDNINVSDTSAIVDQVKRARVSDKAVVDYIPFYTVNAMKKIKDIKQTSTTKIQSLLFPTSGQSTLILNVPEGYDGNLSFVRFNVVQLAKELCSRAADMATVYTFHDGMQALSRSVKSGTVSLDVAKHADKIIITASISENIKWIDDPLLKVEVITEYFKIGD